MSLGEPDFWACVQSALLQMQPAQIVLRNLGLKALPPWFGDLPFLVDALDLADNALTVFPPEILHLDNLRVLVLDNNALKSIPASISDLAGTIEIIGLGHNQLESIPTAMGNLHELRQLHVMFNRLRQLPLSLKNLTKLQEFFADNNELSRLPEACLGMTSLTHLRLDYNKITFISHEIGSMTLLQELDMSSNQLASLPIELGFLRSLRVLHLGINRLMEFPASLVNALRDIELGYSRLTDLGLSFNALTGLPDVIAGVFKQLKVLNMIGNRLMTIPHGVMQLPALEGLYLDSNHITGIPMSIYHLSMLHILSMADNNIK